MLIAYKARNILELNLARDVNTETLAKICETSPTILKESFKEIFGVPIYAWHKQQRIQLACTLIQSDPERTLASIANEVGYSNPSKFSKAFKEFIGETPHEWRKHLLD